jgi:ABC-type Fe3+ transport system permease subunit
MNKKQIEELVMILVQTLVTVLGIFTIFFMLSTILGYFAESINWKINKIFETCIKIIFLISSFVMSYSFFDRHKDRKYQYIIYIPAIYIIM